jgi:hypothetical protein
MCVEGERRKLDVGITGQRLGPDLAHGQRGAEQRLVAKRDAAG